MKDNKNPPKNVNENALDDDLAGSKHLQKPKKRIWTASLITWIIIEGVK